MVARCFATAAEAEAKHREVMDQIVGDLRFRRGRCGQLDSAGRYRAVSAGKGGRARGGQAAAPAPVAAAAPAADTAVKYDMWGKPIPTTAWWVCESHLKKVFLCDAAIFWRDQQSRGQRHFSVVHGRPDQEVPRGGNRKLQQVRDAGGGRAGERRSRLAKASGTGYQFQTIDWTYAPDAAAAAAPAPVKAATPAAMRR